MLAVLRAKTFVQALELANVTAYALTEGYSPAGKSPVCRGQPLHQSRHYRSDRCSATLW
ncbi:MAG: hypothetical protein P3X23_011565 [Thermosynechococcus sp. Uc]|nr:hypothetical protein [Thermosynechococcus sp. Uc]MDM7327726.1 hypothetical protein [Thermosynechococcus sp. Uc]